MSRAFVTSISRKAKYGLDSNVAGIRLVNYLSVHAVLQAAALKWAHVLNSTAVAETTCVMNTGSLKTSQVAHASMVGFPISAASELEVLG